MANTRAASRELWWHVDELFVVCQQADRDVLADPGAALDGSDPVRPVRGESEHRRVAGEGGLEPVTTEERFVAGHHTSIVAERLWGWKFEVWSSQVGATE